MKSTRRKSEQTVHRKKTKALEASEVARERTEAALRKERDGLELQLREGALARMKVDENLHAEITQRMEAERRIFYLNRVHGMLRRIHDAIVRTSDRGRLFEVACRIIVEEGEFPLTWISLIDETTAAMEIAAQCGEADNYGEYYQMSLPDIAEGRGLTATAIRDMTPAVCNDIEADEQLFSLAVQGEILRHGFRSLAVFPLVVFGSVRGVITLCAKETDFFDERETDLLEDLASDLSRALEAIEHGEQLSKWQMTLSANERQLSLIYNNVNDPMFYLAVEPIERYRIISVNRALLRLFSLTEAEVLDKLVQELLKEPEYTITLEHHRKAIRERKSVSWEEALDFPLGKKHVEISITPIFDEKGRCANLVGIVHVITERRRAENALKDSGSTIATSSKLHTTYSSFLSFGRRIFSKMTEKHAKSTDSEKKNYM